MAKSPQQPLRSLEPKNHRQASYSQQIKSSPLVFGIGPAGTGKTYIAAHAAANKLYNDSDAKLIMVRPTITVDDEEIGALPGGIGEKMAPFAKPIMYELTKIAGEERVRTWEKRIEFCPIAFVRGRTFENAFVHVSEAQNINMKQATAIVTRMGENSTLVIEGDPDQSDLNTCFLDEMINVARRGRIHHAVTRFRTEDIVRSRLAKAWVEALVI
jgi:phosphate starvation-inducible PhoH-like protein